jgi:hypothetical protein
MVMEFRSFCGLEFGPLPRNQPLTTDDMARLVPPALAREASDGMSQRYTYIPTIEIINGMREELRSPCRIEAEISPLSYLAERARATSADYDRQQGRLATLDAGFERKKLVVSTLEYASLRDGLQQQDLIVESARKARDIAEAQLADAQAEDDRQTIF